MEERNWICQIRPGNPFDKGRLGPEDFFRPERASQIIFEEGIFPEVFVPPSRTIILKNKWFCAVEEYVYSRPKRSSPIHKTSRPSAFHICLPENVRGRKVVFLSPNTPNPLAIR